MSSTQAKLILLGVGQVARNVAKLADNYHLVGTTRHKSKTQSLKELGIEPILIEQDPKLIEQISITSILYGADVLVSFPPDDESDCIFSALCTRVKKIIYISSTSVYGNYQGLVDETTATDKSNLRSQMRLQAEQYWLNKGATILRAPGLYDAQSGLHLRLNNGTYKLPAKSENYISRIHLTDLARIILAAFSKPLPDKSIYLVGDLKPATQLEVAQWLCQQLKKPLPEQLPPEETPISLSANRQINARKILSELQIDLQFPTYKEGYQQCLAESGLLSSYDHV